jgi:hypothetical protein
LSCAAPEGVRAQYGVSPNADNTLTITNFTGTNAAITIPATIGGSNVTVIGGQAFINATNLTSVTIQTNIDSIGASAFGGCVGLTTMAIPSSVTNLGLPVFDGCKNLTAINVDAQNSNYTSISGVLFDITQSNLLEYPEGLTGPYAIPGTVTNIGAEAFFDCSGLTAITIPSSVNTIGQQAFFGCSALQNVVIPNGVTDLNYATFYGCIGLTNVELPVGLTNIDGSVFHDCNNLSSIVIPGTVVSIGDSSFLNCSGLTNIVLPDSITNIDAAAFYNCYSLSSVALPTNLTMVGAEVFALCGGLTNVVIPTNVDNIGFAAFDGASNLVTVDIPDSVTNLAQYSFSDCTSLTNITIPGSVTNIGPYAFQNSTNLTTVTFTGNAPNGDSTIFESDTNVTINYAPGTTGWSNGFGGVISGSLEVVISPVAAITAGAQWQVDGGTLQNSGAAVVGLSGGTHTISFTPASGSSAPPDRTITVVANAITKTIGLYVPDAAPADGLVLITNGPGTIQHAKWPAKLVIGSKYTVIATPAAKNVFVNWYGGTNQPYSVQSVSAHYTFTMQSNLVLEANFQTNYYLTAAGAYKGLFAPADAARQQSDSGSFSFNLTSAGAVSGTLDVGGQNVPVSGKFDANGSATLISKATRAIPSITATLQLDFADQSISGAVSNATFSAALSGDRAVFSAKAKATQFAGQYTMILGGTNDPAASPYGTSYAAVKVSATGALTLAGSLADGTSASQSSEISKDGRWPVYISLYGGKGSLWGWNFLTNGVITNSAGLSWINATNTVKTAAYRTGFTNQAVPVTGAAYVSTNLGLPANLAVILAMADTYTSNSVTLAANDKITAVGATNKLSLTLNKTTGVITGSFANPAEPKQLIKFGGVVIEGQSEAEGYFLTLPRSGSFLLAPAAPN